MPEWLPGDDAAVLVCGAGMAGASAVRALLLRRGPRVLVSAREETDQVRELVELGAQFVGDIQTVPAGVGLVIVSPGLPAAHPLPLDALAHGIEVLGELEFAWRLNGARATAWLMVTGTNGKTTTTRMLESILLAGGWRAAAVGNVGVPVIDAVLAEHPYDVLAVEASSQQLHWSATIIPAAGAWLNLAPDHIDWHGSFEEYANAKEKVWHGAIAVGNADDPEIAARLARSPAFKSVSFTLGEPVPGQLGVADGWLVDRAFSREAGGAPLASVADIVPPGEHNVANALAAAALGLAYRASPAMIGAGLRAFIPDPHRNELVHSHDDVDYVDDSKATNPHAARASLTGYEHVVWIAGGQLKGAPVDDLVAEIAPRLRAVVLLGQDRAVIADALRRHAPDVPVIDVSRTDDGAMTEVVRHAAGFARPGDVVLLAPAAASYDMFSGYPARGAAFAAAARALAG